LTHSVFIGVRGREEIEEEETGKEVLHGFGFD
jgi:hypothetical protein